MPPISLVTAVHIAQTLVSIVLFVVVQQLPMLSTFGFESACLFSAVLGPIFLCCAALNKRDDGFYHILVRELLWLAIHIGVIASLLFINGFYLQSCSLAEGSLPFFVILVPPLLLNVTVGTTIAVLFQRRGIKLVVAIICYLAYVAAVVIAWWFDPSFRIFTHASLILTSDLLRGDALTPAVVGFRLATLLLCSALIIFGLIFLEDNKLRMFKETTRRPYASVMVIVGILVLHTALHIKSKEAIGKNTGDLKQDYSLLAEAENIRVFANSEKTSRKDAKLILDEALIYRKRITTRLGPLSTAPITIWLHHSDDDKFLYTGARNVHFALPKHREIHISKAKVPHDVLGHELAHIYVGETSRTWLGLPGKNFGVPNLALTEGLAVFLSSELTIDNGLTLLQQAQAIYQIPLNIDVEKLFESNTYFAMSHPRATYIYAGATLEFFLSALPDDQARNVLHEIITNGSLSPLFVDEDDRTLKYAAFLQTLAQALPPHAVSWARTTFLPTSILAADCKSDIVFDKKILVSSVLNDDLDGIRKLLKPLSEKNRKFYLEYAITNLLEQGHFSSALDLITWRKSQVDDSIDRTMQEVDALIHLMKFEDAVFVLDNIDEHLVPIATRRLILATKIFLHELFARRDYELDRAALNFLFSKNHEHSPLLAELAEKIGAVPSTNPSAVLANYILARAYMRWGKTTLAIPLIENVRAHRNLLPPIISREAHIMLGNATMAIEDYERARTIFTELAGEMLSPAEQVFVADQLDRVQFKIQRLSSRTSSITTK